MPRTLPLALPLLAILLLVVEGQSGWRTCPVDVASTCDNSGRCRAYGGSASNIVCRACKVGFTRNPDTGECVECNVPGCALCRQRNRCDTCSNSMQLVMSGNGPPTCSPQTCPLACAVCDSSGGGSTCTNCWPCGKRFRTSMADTVASVAARCGVDVDNLLAANPNLSGRTANSTLGDVNLVKVPPIPCPGSTSTAGGGINPDCPINQVWLSCWGSVYCPLVFDAAAGVNRTYGCVAADTCLNLYGSCLEANPDCPSCCFSRICSPDMGAQRPEAWYFMTFDDGSAHCDPPGRWVNGRKL